MRLPLPRATAVPIVVSTIAKLETRVAVIVPFESPSGASIDALLQLVASDMERVNAAILSRTESACREKT